MATRRRARLAGADGSTFDRIGLIGTASSPSACSSRPARLARLADGAGLGLPADDLVISANAVIVSLVVGLVVTVVASLAPALRISKVAPLAALREVAIDRSGASRGPYRGRLRPPSSRLSASPWSSAWPLRATAKPP